MTSIDKHKNSVLNNCLFFFLKNLKLSLAVVLILSMLLVKSVRSDLDFEAGFTFAFFMIGIGYEFVIPLLEKVRDETFSQIEESSQ